MGAWYRRPIALRLGEYALIAAIFVEPTSAGKLAFRPAARARSRIGHVTEPDRTGWRPSSTSANAVLPPPTGPTTAQVSPSRKVQVRSRNSTSPPAARVIVARSRRIRSAGMAGDIQC